jgi:ribosomal-protein-alanine N-acetyltransferase
VQTIGVTGSRQRAGIGTQLLTELIDEAARRGCRRLDLEVRADNAHAIALYEHHGFHRIGVRRGYYQPSGTDAVVMRRERTP